MKKTKFEKIKEQQEKARNKEILYRVEEILKYKPDITSDLLLEAVKQLHIYGYVLPDKLQKLLLPGYKIIEIATNNEVNKQWNKMKW